MSIPKVWNIDYACGHSGEMDLSQKRIDQRAGYAKWLEKRDCFECYKGKGTKKVSKERQKERAEELEKVAVQEKRDGLLPLSGSEKQQEWARTLRGEVLAGLYDLYVTSEEHDEEWFESEVLTPARMIATSRWWIDNREFGLPAFPELLAAGAQSDDASENVA